MSDNPQASLEATPEQVFYAGVLNKGMLIGLVILLITFAIYVSGILSPHVPLDELSRYWGLSVNDYLHQANIKAGWAWVGMLKYGDFLNFIGVAVLAGITIVCYLAIIPTLLRNRDRLYAVLAAAEVIILVLAASGILAGGAH